MYNSNYHSTTKIGLKTKLSLKNAFKLSTTAMQRVTIAITLSNCSGPVLRLYLILPLYEVKDLSPATIVLVRRWWIDGPRAGIEASTLMQLKIFVAFNIIEHHSIVGSDRDSGGFPKCVDPEHFSPTLAASMYILEAIVHVWYSRAGSFPAGE